VCVCVYKEEPVSALVCTRPMHLKYKFKQASWGGLWSFSC